MNDIKLYVSERLKHHLLIHSTRIYSNDIRMSSGLECSRMVRKRGKVVRTVGLHYQKPIL